MTSTLDSIRYDAKGARAAWYHIVDFRKFHTTTDAMLYIVKVFLSCNLNEDYLKEIINLVNAGEVQGMLIINQEDGNYRVMNASDVLFFFDVELS